jgi:Sensors of blue-light using FAD
MSSLVYVSKATPLCADKSHLIHIATKAQRANGSRDLTGILVYSNGYFMQMLEGPEDSLLETFTVISADPRHEDIEMLSFEETVPRMFDDWNMNLVTLTESIDETTNRLNTIRQSFRNNPLMHCAEAVEHFIAP